MEAVLRERQVHSNRTGQPLDPCPVKESQQPGKASGPEQSLARLQVLRTKRAEQRLVAAVPSAAVHDETAPISTSLSISQHVSSKPTTTAASSNSSSRRLRAKVTTTVGTGMQRQAPSRCSSAACSVRSSLEMHPQQAQHTPGGHVMQGLFSSAHKPAGLLQVDSGLRVAGTSVSKPQRQPQQPQQQQTKQPQHGAVTKSAQPAVFNSHGSRSSSSLRPHCQPALLCATAQATGLPGRCYAAAASAHVLATAFMGCGAPWAELQAAAVGAGAVQAPRVGSNLEHRRQVQQCRQAIAHLVVQQWRWFSSSRRQQRAAEGLRNRRLMAAGWHGLSQEARRMQLLGCRAQLQATQQSYMLLSRAFTNWQQLVELRKRLETVIDTLQAHRYRQSLRAVLQAWQEYVQHKRHKRQLLLRAEACYGFMTLLRVLQQWRAHTTDKQVARLRAARADQHWQRVVYHHVLQHWQAKAARGVAKWQSLAKALCFQKQQLLRKAIQGWDQAMQEQQDVRAAAETAFHRVAQMLELQSAADTLQAWLQAAQLQAQHRQLLEQAAAARQQRTQQQVLYHWHQLVLYHQQLAAAAEALQRVQPGWWVSHSFWRWRAIAQVLAGQRGDELRELVQLRACLGTWLKYTELRRRKAARLSAVKAALSHLRLAKLLPAWQEVTTQQQHKHAQVQLAQQHYHDQLRRRMLSTWQDSAAQAVVERLQLTAAAELHRLRLLAAGLKALAWYPRYVALKAAAPEHYQHRLLVRALTAWRHRTANKQHAEQQRRLAVRHNYLHTLSKALQAWRESMESAGHKQQQVAAVQQHYNTKLLSTVLQEWQGPLLQHLRQKHQQQAAADALAKRHRLARCMSAWVAAVEARHSKQARVAAAEQFRQQRLLRQGLQAFLLVHAEAQQERRELAVAAGPALQALGQRRQRLVVRAWLAAVRQQQHQHALGQVAEQHARRLFLRRSMRQWERYLLYRRRKAAQTEVALRHHEVVLLTSGLAAFRQGVQCAADKHKRVFAAAIHRRSWLIWRAIRAWRLSAAVSHLERIISRPSTMLAPAEALGSSSCSAQPTVRLAQQQGQQRGLFASPVRQRQQQTSNMQPGQDHTVVAAAVVEASCASHRQWQDEWRSKWREALAQTQQQQLLPPPPGSWSSQPDAQAECQQAVQQPWEQVQASQISLHAVSLAQRVPALPPAAADTASLAPGGCYCGAAASMSRPGSSLPPAALALAHTAEAHAGSGSAGSMVAGGIRPVRRQPRLPSFMVQASQQQQQQHQQPLAPLFAHSDRPSSQQGHQHLQPAQAMPTAAGHRPVSPALWPDPADAVTEVSAASTAAAVSGVDAFQSSIGQQLPSRPVPAVPQLTWHSPLVAKKVRLQPRQLRPSLLDNWGPRDSGIPGPLQQQWQHSEEAQAGHQQLLEQQQLQGYHSSLGGVDAQHTDIKHFMTMYRWL